MRPPLVPAALLSAAHGLLLEGRFGPSAASRLEWQLFPAGRVPGERPDSYGPEARVPPDPSDPMGAKCSPGDTTGEWFYNVTEPSVMPFLVSPAAPSHRDAAVIVLPGGGFSFLTWTKEGTEAAKWLNSLGISAFVLKYRVPVRPWLHDAREKHLAARMDAQRALSLVRHRAAKVGINASRIGFLGFSAGGILSTEVAGSPARLYKRIDEVDDVPAHPDFQLLIYAAGDPKYVKKRRQPATFLAIAQDDQCVDIGLALNYYSAVRRNAPPSELHVFPSGRHGFGACRGGYPDRWYAACTWTNQSMLFLEQQVLS